MSEVCKICFNSSSHKTNPTLTPETKAVIDPSTKKKTCPSCKQLWNGLQVARDVEINKWVPIRRRPKISQMIDYQLCASVQRKIPCPKGQAGCTFAHSKAELLAWNKDRWKEARPVPSASAGLHQYQLCKHVQTDGICPYGQRCTFAHSEEELQIWIYGYKVEERTATILPKAPLELSMPEFYCRTCDLHCTSHRQLEEHVSGAKHKQMLASRDFPYQAVQVPRMPQSHHPSYPTSIPGTSVRSRPNRFPVHGYRLCNSLVSGRRCFYGEACSFAHSEMELDAWNQELHTIRQMNYSHFSLASQPLSAAAQSVISSRVDLDEFIAADHTIVDKCGDFAQEIRQRLILLQQDQKAVTGLEKVKDHVSITEISGTSEAITVNKMEDTISWIYEVSATIPRQLLSVVLFDILAPEFTIEEVNLVMYGGYVRNIHPISRAQNGSGLQVDQLINPPDKVHVKVSFRPRYGLLGQVVLFDFNSFQMMRCLSAHVVNEQEALLLHHSNVNRPARKIDLFLEQRFTTMDWLGNEFTEPADRNLGDYMLPEQVEKLIDSGKYKNVEQKITKENYVRRMHNLMYVEEYQQRKDLSRYDLCDIEVSPQDKIKIGEWLIHDPKYFFICVNLDETLFEGGRSIRTGDLAMLLPVNQCVVHECYVEAVGRETVVLKITHIAREACQASRNRCSVRFILSRVQMRAMHQAVDSLEVDVLFPEFSADIISQTLKSSAIDCCFKELEKSELTPNQQLAVKSMLDPSLKQIPTLVLGPFGCGKTRALLECVKLLGLYATSESRLLICTHSNSAADLYVEAIHKEWQARNLGLAPMFRLYFSGRNLSTVNETVKLYSRIVEGKFADLLPSELSPFSIIVSTLVNARKLWLLGMKKGNFSHILIDEAAQALESEAAIALCLADKNTKIVLAGDHMQMDPPVYSSIARKYGLHISLLERLYDCEVYLSAPPVNNCKILLTENHRSHQQILQLPSKLFYNNKLSCKAIFPQTGPKDIAPIQFVGVDGHECQDEDSPSYYNDQEVFEVANEVEKLHHHQNGLDQSDICVLADFRKQVQRIRTHLRKRKFPQVKVFRVDDVQGKEFRALLISTVRTCATDAKRLDEIEMEDGFFTNPKLFNTAITRAREWLVIIGEPITLCTVGYNSTCWLELIQKCLELKTFHYPMSQLFMNFLEGRLITRQILQKQHGEFFKKSFSSPTEKPLSASGGAYDQSITDISQQMSSITLQHQSHVQQLPQLVRDRVAASAQNASFILHISEEVLNLPPGQLNSFLNDSDYASKYVRELEMTLKRRGPASVLMNTARLQPPLSEPSPAVTSPLISLDHTQHSTKILPHNTGFGVPINPPNIANLMGDLPPFLSQQLDSLTRHLKWCESINTDTLPPVVQQNLLQQKSLLQTQMKIANDQILKYREFIKLTQYIQAQILPKNLLPPNMPVSFSHPGSFLKQGTILPPPPEQLISQSPLTQSFSQTMGPVDSMLASNNIRQTRPFGVPMCTSITGPIGQFTNISLPMGVDSGYDFSNLPQSSVQHSAQQQNILPQSIGQDMTVLGYRDFPQGHKQDSQSLTSQPLSQDHIGGGNFHSQTTQLISPLSNLPSAAVSSQLHSGTLTSTRIPPHRYGNQEDLYVSDDDI